MAVTSPRANAGLLHPTIPIDHDNPDEHRRLLANTIAEMAQNWVKWPVEVQAVSATYTMQDADLAVLCSSTAATTVFLVSAKGREGRRSIVKKVVGTSQVIVHTVDSETIDGTASLTLSTAQSGREFLSDGTNWHVIGSF